jgi:hypothetical protein
MIITMSSTVGQYTNGQTYRLRSKEAEAFIKATQATKNHTRKP